MGLEKTGTTSIQRALDQHRENLEELGYYYPKSIAVGLNTHLATLFSSSLRGRPQFQSIMKKNGGSEKAFKNQLTEKLASEYDNTPAQKLILSSEFLARAGDLSELKAYCDEHAETTVVIIYIREQVSFALSLYSTFLKSGGVDFNTLKRLEKNELPDSFNFAKIIENLEKYFAGNVKVRLFQKTNLKNGDATQDFCFAIGLGKKALDFVIPKQNESLSYTGSEFLKAVNPVFPSMKNGNRNVARDMLLADMAKLDLGGTYGDQSLPPKIVRQIQTLSAPGNEWVRENYFPNRKRLFKPYKNKAKSKQSEDKLLEYAALLTQKAYDRSQDQKELLSEIAPVLTEASKNIAAESLKERLIELNRTILKNR